MGGAIGLAVLATLATERTDGLRADGVAREAALNSGYHLAYLIGAALVAVGIAVAVGVVRSEPPATAAEEPDAEAEPDDEEQVYAEAACPRGPDRQESPPKRAFLCDSGR